MNDSENLSRRPWVGTIELDIVGQHIPSFKNTKKSNRRGHIYTPAKIKQRMEWLENAILSELYSESQIIAPETHSECLKRLRTALSGLCDDSIKQIPNGQWLTLKTAKGCEGIKIEISECEI